jgi:hypothetical protein
MVSMHMQQLLISQRWPPDDTEESVVGTNRHQLTIRGLCMWLNELAHAAVAPGQPVPWHALSQTMLTGFHRPDGSRYTTLPDIFVYPKPMNYDRASLSVLLEGPPMLIIEVASDSTYDSELDLSAGKAWTYAHGGVREYLVLDPSGNFLPTPGRGWRLRNGEYVAWEPDDENIWWSEEIAAGFSIVDGPATIYDRSRRPQPQEGEILNLLARKDDEIAELQRRLADLERKSS